MCLWKTLNVKFSKWRTIRASTTSNPHTQTISLGYSLCSHGNPTQLTNILMNKTKEMAKQYEWHSYCSSILKYDNQCFWDALWLYYSTVVLKWNATDKIWDFSTTDVAIWMKQSVVQSTLWGGS